MEVVAALDAAKLSDRQAVHILMACADAIGVNLSSAVLSRSSIDSDKNSE